MKCKGCNGEATHEVVGHIKDSVKVNYSDKDILYLCDFCLRLLKRIAKAQGYKLKSQRWLPIHKQHSEGGRVNE